VHDARELSEIDAAHIMEQGEKGRGRESFEERE
jgi:hypothetical protein